MTFDWGMERCFTYVIDEHLSSIHIEIEYYKQETKNKYDSV